MAKTYETYKDSGIEWIGQIPEMWKIKKLGYVGDFTASGIDKKVLNEEEPVKIINYTDVYGNINRTIDSSFNFMVVTAKEEKIKENSVKKGDLIFTPTSETIKEIGLSALVVEDLVNTAFSYHVLRFQFKEGVDFHFRKYLCNNHFVLNQFSIKAQGITRYTLRRADFKNTLVVLPPPEEQTQIANYLDHKTRLIDNIIYQKEQLISTLKEQRQTIINEAVTKGLNPNATLKDSGIGWLGEIPEHWEVVKLKYLVNHSTDKGDGLSDFKIGLENIESKTGELIFSESKEFEGDLKRFKKGNVLFNKLRPYLAKVLIAPKNGECVSELLVFEALEKRITSEFLFLRLSSEQIISIVDSSTYGAKMPRASIDFILNLPIPVPSKEEQFKISEKINTIQKSINKSIEILNISIEKLKEYRQSLISEAVTGKIDVRDWQVSKE